MRWIACFCFWIVAGLAAPAFANSEIHYGPAPTWVERAPASVASPDSGGAIELLIDDKQVRFRPDGQDYYSETAYKILNAQGLQGLGTIGTVWDPTHSDLTINTAQIIRGGQTIDLLATNRDFRVLQREPGLSSAMIDGNLTAIKEISDLRVGDVVEFAVTIERQPLLAGASAEDWLALPPGGTIDHVRYRAVWPRAMAIRWNATRGIDGAHLFEKGNQNELVYEATGLKIPEPPTDAPQRYNNLGEIELTAYKSWADISRLFAPLYASASALPAGSPVKAEAQKIRQAYASDEDRTLAALKLVQEQVRYFALVLGVGGYTPTAADQTWTQRFGDCKAKSALLMALLRELGVKAEAAVVTSVNGEGAPARLPRLSVFNHVIVRAEIKGKVYWLDGTRSGDNDLSALSDSQFGYALPIRSGGAEFERLQMHPATRPINETTIELDASGGLDVDGPGSFELIMRGDGGRAMTQLMSAAPRADAEKYIRDTWGQQLDWLKIDTVEFGPSEEESGYRILLRGHGKFEWPVNRQTGIRQLSIEGSFDEAFDERKDNDPPDVPFALEFPRYEHTLTRIRLPQSGDGFHLFGDDVDKIVAGLEIKRRSAISNGEAVVDFSVRSLQSEVPSAEAHASKARFAALPTKHETFVNAPRAMLAPLTADSSAEDLVQRGFSLAAQGKPDEARQALEQAVAKDPNSPAARAAQVQILFSTGKQDEAIAAGRRMTAEMPKEQPGHAALTYGLMTAGRYQEALAEANAAAAIDATWTSPAYYRAMIYMKTDKPQEMLDSLEALKVLAGANSSQVGWAGFAVEIRRKPAAAKAEFVRVLQANAGSVLARAIYGRMLESEDPKGAIEQYDAALRLQPDMTSVLQGRAVQYVEMGDDVHALADLDRLLRTVHDQPLLYDLRAQIYIRMGRFDEALLDFDDGLKLGPSNTELLGERCRMKAQLGRDLEQALDDCNKALVGRNGDYMALTNRGLVRLKMNSLEEARADFAASAAAFDSAEARVGLGLAERRLGRVAEGDQDIAKGRSYDPAVMRTFDQFNLAP